MAKGRKPAIDGIARPQGILDDIVRPIIQKGAKAVKSKVWVNQVGKKGKDSARVIEGRLFRTADRVEYSTRMARQKSYSQKARVAVAKEKSPKKIDVLQSKARAAGNPVYSVRKAAKGARRRGGYR